VHREDCANAIALAADEKERLIEVEWDEERTGVFVAAIEVKALDRNRLLADVAKVLSEHHVSIISSSTHTKPDRVSRMRFEFELADPEHLDSLLENLRLLDVSTTPTGSFPGGAVLSHGRRVTAFQSPKGTRTFSLRKATRLV